MVLNLKFKVTFRFVQNMSLCSDILGYVRAILNCVHCENINTLGKIFINACTSNKCVWDSNIPLNVCLRYYHFSKIMDKISTINLCHPKTEIPHWNGYECTFTIYSLKP